MPVPGQHLSLADLEAFDPHYPRTGGAKVRVCCPFCGGEKRRDETHRCLSYNDTTGAYRCWRCSATGKLKDFWTDDDKKPLGPIKGKAAMQRDRAEEARSRFGIASPSFLPQANGTFRPSTGNVGSATANSKPSIQSKPMAETLAACLGGKKLSGIVGGPGAVYLAGRGLDPALCDAAGVRFGDCYGKAAILFSIRDQGGKLVALQGRYIAPDASPRMRTAGDRKRGVFSTPGALDKETIPVFVEAPLDALSLSAAGVPAFALCGSDGVPEWLINRLVFRTVIAAFDADEAGDKAAVKLATLMAGVGGTVKRLRPCTGKDWNEILKRGGVDALKKEVAPLTTELRRTEEHTAVSSPPVTQARTGSPVTTTTTAPRQTSDFPGESWEDPLPLPAREPEPVKALPDYEPLPVSPEVEDFRDSLTEEEHRAFISSLLAAANENRLPVPSESFLLRPGEWITDPNAYLRKAMERFNLLKSRLTVSNQQETRRREAIDKIMDDFDRVAVWSIKQTDQRAEETTDTGDDLEVFFAE